MNGNRFLSIFFSFALITKVVLEVIPSKCAIATFLKYKHKEYFWLKVGTKKRGRYEGSAEDSRQGIDRTAP